MAQTFSIMIAKEVAVALGGRMVAVGVPVWVGIGVLVGVFVGVVVGGTCVTGPQAAKHRDKFKINSGARRFIDPLMPSIVTR